MNPYHNQTTLYPLLFERNFHPAIWGGEEWLVSGHHSSPSVIANGPLNGMTLETAAQEFGRALMGANAPHEERFPLLFKLIETHDKLSVQVHPNETTAKTVGGEPKTEMWYALERKAELHAGFNPGVGKEDVARAIREVNLERILTKVELQPGKALFIPGGLVHAIGADALIYEVQQSSDTTYRMYDWGRVGKDGKPRTLHVEQSLATIDCSLRPSVSDGEVICPHFRFAPWKLSETRDLPGDVGTFRVLYAAEGTVRITWGNDEVRLDAGRAALIPANVPTHIVPEHDTLLLVTEIPNARM